MADVSILAGATSQSILVDLYILATGAGQTALVFNSSGLTAYYSFAGASATATAITLATLASATTAWSSGGFIKLDDTNMPGLYRLDIPNAALAAAKGREVCITFNGFSGMATRHIKVELTGWDNQSATNGGLSALPTATAGASNGLLISGTNSGTTTFGALTCTGILTVSNGIVVTVSSANVSALQLTGNGTGSGAVFTSGSGATGDGIQFTSNSTNGNGITSAGKGTGPGFKTTGGLTGVGCNIIGGGTSGDGIKVTTTSGHGINLAPVGTSMHGLFSTGGNGGTSDGIKAAAGTGGVDIRGAITGNITGNLSGSVGSVTGLTASNLDTTVSSRMATYTQPTGFLAATFPSGTVANTTNITAGTITTATNLTNAATSGDLTATMKTSVTTAANAATTVGITSNRKKAATATFEFLMQDSTTGAPKTGLTVAATISKDGGASGATSNSVTEIGLGQYQIVLTGTEMTANNIFLQFTASGAVTSNISVQTQP